MAAYQGKEATPETNHHHSLAFPCRAFPPRFLAAIEMASVQKELVNMGIEPMTLACTSG